MIEQSRHSKYGVPYTITVRDVDPALWKRLKKAAETRGLTTAELANQILTGWADSDEAR